MRAGDTIVALSSGGLPSGVAVVRVSGPKSADIIRLLAGRLPRPRQLSRADLAGPDGFPLDQAMIVWFPAPKSFTGEDCAEFHLHGSAAVVRAVLRLISEVDSVRLADAGEFTRRAFENGKLDLTEVEGLGDLIAAETEDQRRQAMSRLEGALSRQVNTWRDRLLDARAEIEARLDFSDEGDVDDALPGHWAAELKDLAAELRRVAAGSESGRVVREGFRVALAGAPNAGKSSLLNVLAKSEVAIVTEEAGTTRDVREVPIDLDGQLVVLVDMAGLRDTDSLAEQEGVRRAREEVHRADLLLWLQAPDAAAVIADIPESAVKIGTKSDISEQTGMDLCLSSRTGTGLNALTALLSERIGDRVGKETTLVSRERDRIALMASADAVEGAFACLDQPELAAEQLRIASDALARLIGDLDPETVLDRLFSAFCIGK